MSVWESLGETSLFRACVGAAAFLCVFGIGTARLRVVFQKGRHGAAARLRETEHDSGVPSAPEEGFAGASSLPFPAVGASRMGPCVFSFLLLHV